MTRAENRPFRLAFSKLKSELPAAQNELLEEARPRFKAFLDLQRETQRARIEAQLPHLRHVVDVLNDTYAYAQAHSINAPNPKPFADQLARLEKQLADLDASYLPSLPTWAVFQKFEASRRYAESGLAKMDAAPAFQPPPQFQHDDTLSLLGWRS